jgi:Integrase core domain
MGRALDRFAELGVTVEGVLTDNGACYPPQSFATLCAAPVPPTNGPVPTVPRTNGKVERFNLTLKWEWANSISYGPNSERLAALEPWVHRYNRHRPKGPPGRHAHGRSRQHPVELQLGTAWLGVVPRHVVLRKASLVIRDKPESKEALVSHPRAKLSVRAEGSLCGGSWRKGGTGSGG